MKYMGDQGSHSPHLLVPILNISSGSRNFKTRGRGPGAVELLESEICFDATFTRAYPMLVVRVENKEQSCCKNCMMATINVYACSSVKIYKHKPKRISKY